MLISFIIMSRGESSDALAVGVAIITDLFLTRSLHYPYSKSSGGRFTLPTAGNA